MRRLDVIPNYYCSDCGARFSRARYDHAIRRAFRITIEFKRYEIWACGDKERCRGADPKSWWREDGTGIWWSRT